MPAIVVLLGKKYAKVFFDILKFRFCEHVPFIHYYCFCNLVVKSVGAISI
jgi:hypothetical protein